jgi:hypothetical protein
MSSEALAMSKAGDLNNHGSNNNANNRNTTSPVMVANTEPVNLDLESIVLPEPVHLFLLDRLKVYISQIMDGHPIASRLTNEAVAIAEEEVLLECFETAKISFVALILNDKHTHVKKLLDVNIFSEELMRSREVIDIFNQTASSVMKLTVGKFQLCPTLEILCV